MLLLTLCIKLVSSACSCGCRLLLMLETVKYSSHDQRSVSWHKALVGLMRCGTARILRPSDRVAAISIGVRRLLSKCIVFSSPAQLLPLVIAGNPISIFPFRVVQVVSPSVYVVHSRVIRSCYLFTTRCYSLGCLFRVLQGIARPVTAVGYSGISSARILRSF